MRYLQFILAIAFSGCLFSQSLSPSVFNTDGGNATIASPTGQVSIYYNIGEPVYDDIKNESSGTRLTQGFLQPDVVGFGALQIATYTTAMTCHSSNDASIVLNANGANAPFSYRWYKNGTLIPDTNSYLLNLAVGSYSYSVKDAKGNLRSSSLQVYAGEGTCTIVIHNGISANNDGHNDFFHIEHIEDYTNNNVAIYNRWGGLVWEGNGYDNSTVVWKGEDVRGNVLPSGTYFFTVVIDGNKTTGWVELMR